MSHRVFTDSTEKQAVDQDDINYDNTNKSRDECTASTFHVMKHALNTDQRPSILMSCDELHKAVHDMRSEDIVLDEHSISDHR